HGGAQAAQLVQAQSGFEVIQMQFDFTAPGIPLGQELEGPELAVQQGGDQDDFLAAAGGGGDFETEQTHGQGGGQSGPLLGGEIAPARLGFGPGDQPFIGSQRAALAKVGVAAGMAAEEAIDLELTEAGQHGPGTKVAIPQDQVARAEGGPELLEEGVFTGAVGTV